MGQLREDSLLFSLNALEELERERAERERTERASRERAARLSLEQDEQLRREAEARRARTEIVRKREEGLRHREEEERIGAMREAVLERARVEADWEGRLALEAQERRHQERLADLEVSGHRRRARVGFACAAVAVAVGLASVALLGRRLDETARLVEQQAGNLELERESRARATQLLERSDERARELSRRLQAAEADERADDSPPAALPGRESGVLHSRPTRAARPEVLPTPKPPCVDDGDPMSGCLPTGIRAAGRR